MNNRRSSLIGALVTMCAASLPSYEVDAAVPVHLRLPRFEEFDKEGQSAARNNIAANRLVFYVCRPGLGFVPPPTLEEVNRGLAATKRLAARYKIQFFRVPERYGDYDCVFRRAHNDVMFAAVERKFGKPVAHLVDIARFDREVQLEPSEVRAR